MERKKVWAVYFSATDTTKKIVPVSYTHLKQHVLFAALAAAVALSASGCKSREKIDLDTLHTSEAETMASTEAPGGDRYV